eukprot:g5513.t1
MQYNVELERPFGLTFPLNSNEVRRIEKGRNAEKYNAAVASSGKSKPQILPGDALLYINHNGQKVATTGWGASQIAQFLARCSDDLLELTFLRPAASKDGAASKQTVSAAATWVQHTDPKTGQPFYQNTVTKEVSWEAPDTSSEWVAHMDPRTKTPFYQNQKTKEVRWTLPGDVRAQSAPPVPEWTQYLDPKTNMPFFQNDVTKEVTWTLPKGASAKTVLAPQQASAAEGAAAASTANSTASTTPADTRAVCPIVSQGRNCPIVDAAHLIEFRHPGRAAPLQPPAPSTEETSSQPPVQSQPVAVQNASPQPTAAEAAPKQAAHHESPMAEARAPQFIVSPELLATSNVRHKVQAIETPLREDTTASRRTPGSSARKKSKGRTPGKKKTPKRTPKKTPKKSPKKSPKESPKVRRALGPADETRLEQEAQTLQQQRGLGLELHRALPQPNNLPAGWVVFVTADGSQSFYFSEDRQELRTRAWEKAEARKARQAELEKDLVEGWTVTVNEDETVTYFNSQTKESTWQRPKPKPPPLPPSWSAAIDAATGKEYYYHMVTQEISWVRPTLSDAKLSSTDTSSKYGTLSPTEISTKWMENQAKSFLRWMNFTLKPKQMVVTEITEDLRDGLILAHLLQQVSGTSPGQFNSRPRLRIHRLENINICLNFLRKNEIKLINIQDTHIEEGNLKITLALIWTIILHYQILKVKQQERMRKALQALEDAQRASEQDENARPDQQRQMLSDPSLLESLDHSRREVEVSTQEAQNPKQLLLKWVNSQIKDSGLAEVKNFTADWKDGKVLTALTDSLRPGVLPLASMSGDAYADCSAAINRAEEEFGLPSLLDAVDIVDYSGDVLALMTYISYFKDVWQEQQDIAGGYKVDPRATKVLVASNQLFEVNTEVKYTLQCYTPEGLPLDSHLVAGEVNWLVTLSAPNGEQLHLESPTRVLPPPEDMSVDAQAQSGQAALNPLQFVGSFEPTVPGIHNLTVSLSYMRLGVEVSRPVSNSGLAIPIEEEGTAQRLRQEQQQKEGAAEKLRQEQQQKEQAQKRLQQQEEEEKARKKEEERKAEEERVKAEEEEAKKEQDKGKLASVGKKWHQLDDKRDRKKKESPKTLPTMGKDGNYRVGELQVEFPPGAAKSLSLGIIKIKVFIDLKRRLVVKVCEARGLPGSNSSGGCDPYVKVYLLPDPTKRTKKKTQVLRRKLNPTWNETFFYPAELLDEYLQNHGSTLQLSVWHYNFGANNEFLGHVLLDISRVPTLKSNESSLTSSKGLDRWLAIQPRQMFKLGSCSVKQENCIKYPDGSFRLPDGVFLLPDGTVMDKPAHQNKLSKGSQLLSDGSVLRADATCVLPSNAILRLDGNLRLPDGRVVVPAWACLSAEWPYGVLQLPDFSFTCDGDPIKELPTSDVGVALGVIKVSLAFDQKKEELTVMLFEARGLVGGANPYAQLRLKGARKKDRPRSSKVARPDSRKKGGSRRSVLVDGQAAEEDEEKIMSRQDERVSRIYKDNIDPTFDQHFKFPLAASRLHEEELVLEIKNYKLVGADDSIGLLTLKLKDMAEFLNPAWFALQPTFK